jgi:hypothetical protein
VFDGGTCLFENLRSNAIGYPFCRQVMRSIKLDPIDRYGGSGLFLLEPAPLSDVYNTVAPSQSQASEERTPLKEQVCKTRRLHNFCIFDI